MGAVVIVGSFGAISVLRTLLGGLPADFPAAIAIVQHTHENGPGLLAKVLARDTRLDVTKATDGTRLRPGLVCVAPPGQHLTIAPGEVLHLDRGPRVDHSRPSGTLLFRTAAKVYGNRCIAVVLTGHLQDGAMGVRAVKAAGGVVIAQRPHDCVASGMPTAAIRTGCVDFVLGPDALASALISLVTCPGALGLFIGTHGPSPSAAA